MYGPQSGVSEDVGSGAGMIRRGGAFFGLVERRVHHHRIGDGATEAGRDAFGFRRGDVGNDDGDVGSEAAVCRADERLTC